MKAMLLKKHSPIEEKPLELTDLPPPVPDDNQILVKVSVCGACHTDLDEVEGRLRPTSLPIVLGHQVVGAVADKGKAVTKFKPSKTTDLYHTQGTETTPTEGTPAATFTPLEEPPTSTSKTAVSEKEKEENDG